MFEIITYIGFSLITIYLCYEIIKQLKIQFKDINNKINNKNEWRI